MKNIIYAVMGFFLILSFVNSLNPHVAGWDEAAYVGMGKHIYSGGDSGLWEMIRPIGLPFVLGLFWKLGLPIWFWEMAMVLFAAGNIWLTYKIASKLFNETSGVIAGILVASSTTFFQQASLFMTEIPATFFALAAVYFMIQNKIPSAGVLAALAALFKFPHFMLFIPLLLASKKLTKLWLYFAIVAAFLLTNYGFYSENLTDFRAGIDPLLLAASHQSNPLEATAGLLNNIFFYGIFLAKENVFFLFAILGIAFTHRLQGKKRGFNILLSYLAVYLVYFTYIINKQPRFAMMFMPIVAVFAGYGIYRTINYQKSRRNLRIGILAVVAIILGSTILVTDFNSIAERSEAETPYYEVNGTILASNPKVAFYSDNKVVPIYFSTADGQRGIRNAVERYEENKDAGIILFDINDYYCSDEDEYCSEQLNMISSEVSS